MGSGVLFGDPVAVSAACDILHPRLVFEVPLDGFTDTGCEGFCGVPAELAGDFGGVDCVAFVVSWSIFYEGDEGAVGGLIGSWAQLVEEIADVVYDVDIGHLVVATDVIHLAELP